MAIEFVGISTAYIASGASSADVVAPAPVVTAAVRDQRVRTDPPVIIRVGGQSVVASPVPDTAPGVPGPAVSTPIDLGENGDFDAGIGDWKPWTGFGVPVSVAHDAAFSRTGAGSMRVTRIAGATTAQAVAASTPWPAVFVPPYPGGTVVAIPSSAEGPASASVWYYTAAASILTAWVEIAFLDAADSVVAVLDVFDYTAVHGAWTAVAGSVDLPAGVTQVALTASGLRGTPDEPTEVPPDIGATIWWDDFTLSAFEIPITTTPRGIAVAHVADARLRVS